MVRLQTLQEYLEYEYKTRAEDPSENERESLDLLERVGRTDIAASARTARAVLKRLEGAKEAVDGLLKESGKRPVSTSEDFVLFVSTDETKEGGLERIQAFYHGQGLEYLGQGDVSHIFKGQGFRLGVSYTFSYASIKSRNELRITVKNLGDCQI